MQLKALITTFVLGSSSVAMAHPAPAPAMEPIVRDHRGQAEVEEGCGPARTMPAPAPTPTPVYQPGRQPVYRPMPPEPAPIYQPPVHRATWVTLGGVHRIVDGAMSFRVGAGRFGERFSTLKLQSEAGKSLIQRVLIQFSNGRTQTVEVNRYLNASNPAITIDLEGRARQIAKVTVIGRNARSSAYRVLAI